MSAQIRRFHGYLKVFWGMLLAMLYLIGVPRLCEAQNCAKQECALEGGTYTCNTSSGNQFCTNEGSSCTDQMCPPAAPVGAMLNSDPYPQFEKSNRGCTETTLADLQVNVASHGEIGMGIVEPEPNPPVVLTLAAFGLKDLFLRGKIVNDSPKTVVAYRMGWVFQFPDRPLQFHLGEWMNVPGGIKPNAFQDVPAQNVSPRGIEKSGVTEVKFFVAEAKYADGSHWTPDLGKIKNPKQAVPHAYATLR